MTEFPGGRYPVAIKANMVLLVAVVVDGEIHALSAGGNPERWVFKMNGLPLKVEDHPFSLLPDGGTGATPAMLMVRLQGGDGVSVLASADDYQTWEPYNEYSARFHATARK